MADPSVLIAGEALIDLFPTAPGRLADVETLRRAAGGAPANVAVGMARLGSAPLLWTRLGADPFGAHLEDVLDANGVPDDLVAVDPDRRTAHTLVADDPDADQSFTFFAEGTATFAMEPGTVSDEQLAALEWVHFGGVLLSADPARTAMFDLVERASDAGCTISFDPNTRADLWPDETVLSATIERAVGLADVIKTDREDLAAVLDGQGAVASTGSGTAVEATAADLLAYGPHTVLLTQGADGAYAEATGRAPWGPAIVTRPAFDVDVVETTGAGDGFLAGAITALQERQSLADAVEFATAVGALATTDTGAMAALPDRQAVEALVAGA